MVIVATGVARRRPLGPRWTRPSYVRALDLSVTRLDQTYRRIGSHRFAYTSEADFQAVLEYARRGGGLGRDRR